MWSHYANNHKGFCIEYDFSEDNFIFQQLSPVLYVDKLYDINDNTCNERLFEFCSLLKGVEWRYEKEWRIVINSENLEKEYVKVPKPTAIYLGACIENLNSVQLRYFAKQNNIEVHQMAMSREGFKLIIV